MSQNTFIMGVTGSDYCQIKKLNFEDYVQAHNVNVKEITSTTMGVEEIAL